MTDLSMLAFIKKQERSGKIITANKASSLKARDYLLQFGVQHQFWPVGVLYNVCAREAIIVMLLKFLDFLHSCCKLCKH